MTRTAVYRHFDDQGRLLYVGLSADPKRRTYEHSSRSDWALEIARMDAVWFPTRELAQAAEEKAIKEESPLHNIMLCKTAIFKHMASLNKAPRGPGKSFKAWLRARGIKQIDAARAMGESPQFICNVANGDRSPGLRLALVIEEFTGGEITVRDLADFYDDAQSRRAISDQLLSCEAS